jgi:hypothetical protein
MELLTGVYGATQSFINENDLQGAAWSGMKDQMVAHDAVIRGLSYMLEELIAAGANLVSTCGTEYLSEDVLESQLAMLQHNRSIYEQHLAYYERMLHNELYREIYSQTSYEMIPKYQRLIECTDEKIQMVNEKLDVIDQVDTATSNLNVSVEELMAQVSQGLQYLSGSWTGTGFIPAMGRNLSWMKEINKVKAEKSDDLYEVALMEKLLDPHSSLLQNPKYRELALEFLKEQIKKRGGSIDLRLLDYEKWEDVAVYNAILKLTLGHGVAQGNIDRLLLRFEIMLNNNDIDGSDFGDLLEFDADMLHAVKKDSAKWLKKVQDGGYHRFQEEHQKELSIAAEALTGFSHGMLMVQFMESRGKKESSKDINDAYVAQANWNMSNGAYEAAVKGLGSPMGGAKGVTFGTVAFGGNYNVKPAPTIKTSKWSTGGTKGTTKWTTGSNQGTGGATSDVNKQVLESMNKSKNFYKNSVNSYDCSEIADDLYSAAGNKGKIYEVRSKSGGLNVEEYGVKETFDYHTVYSDGKYVYDPRYSNTPILEKDYFKMIEKWNPNGVDIFEP